MAGRVVLVVIEIWELASQFSVVRIVIINGVSFCLS